MTMDFLDGMIAVMTPSILFVAWMVWRADTKIPSRNRNYKFPEMGGGNPDKLGRASTPNAPPTVQTKRVPNAGAATSSR